MRTTGRAGASALLFLMMPLNASVAQEPDMTRAVPVCDGNFRLCRYVDRATKQEILSARFERAMPFSEGLAAVRIDGRFGYVDRHGEVVIKPRFDLAGDFYQGLAEVLISEEFHKDPFENSVLWTRAYLEFGAGKRAVLPRMLPDRARGG